MLFSDLVMMEILQAKVQEAMQTQNAQKPGGNLAKGDN